MSTGQENTEEVGNCRDKLIKTPQRGTGPSELLMLSTSV